MGRPSPAPTARGHPRPLRKISPVAWQNVHFLGRYVFRGNRQAIDLRRFSPMSRSRLSH